MDACRMRWHSPLVACHKIYSVLLLLPCWVLLPCCVLLLLVCWPQIREFLEKQYVETSGRDTIKLAIRALMETVEASSKNIEIAVMEAAGLRILGDEELDGLVAEVEADKAAAEAAKRSGGAAGTQAQQAS